MIVCLLQQSLYYCFQDLKKIVSYSLTIIIKDMLNKKNLFLDLQIIQNQKYEELYQSFKGKRKTLKDLDSQKICQNPQISVKNQTSQKFYCFKVREKIELPKPSQAILLFRQSYQHILSQNCKRNQDQNVKQILIQFYQEKIVHQNSNSGKKQQLSINPLLTISIQSSKASIYRSQSDPETISLKNFKLFKDLSQKKCLKSLQQKFWLEINKKLNKIALHVGDLQTNQNKKTVIFDEKLMYQVKKENYDWKNCEKILDKICVQKKQKENKLLNLTHVEIFFKFQRKKVEEFQQKDQNVETNNFETNLRKSFLINIYSPSSLLGPKIQESPNLFHQSISPIINLPQQAKTLYSRMKDMNLVTLCRQYSKFKDCHENLSEQIIGESIHNSLMTPWGYAEGKNGLKIPIGILNHLMHIKAGNEVKLVNSQNQESLFPSSLYNHITTKSQGYVRFQIIHPRDICPGNCGVIEIWPPFHCSPLHNHGESIGVVKVLKGEVRIENYESLSCCQNEKQIPYMKNDFRKGDYTWLCQESYGIHRVMNLTPSTAITLQAYYDHNQGSQEYFTFVKKDPQLQSNPEFARYYPQHDWINYLKMNSIQSTWDRHFIKQVIEFYELSSQTTSQIDFSFPKFIDVLRRQYYLVRSLIDDQ